MDNAAVLNNALGLISIMDLAGIKGAQAPLVAETIAGLHRLIGEAGRGSGAAIPSAAPSLDSSPLAISEEIASAGQDAVAP